MELHQLILGGMAIGTIAAVGCLIYRDNKRVEEAVKKCQEPTAKPTFPSTKRQPSSVGQVRSTSPSELRTSSARSATATRRHVDTQRDDDMLNPLNPLSPVSPLNPLNSYAETVRSEPARSEPVSCSRDYDDSSRHSSSWSSSSCSSSSGSSSYDSGSSCSSSSSACD